MEQDDGKQPWPRIMIPLIGSVKEFEHQALLIKKEANAVQAKRKIDIPYKIGTMIEVPRATLVSDKIASAFDPADGKTL
eukprot:3250191-Ditylum_brightwellii.AAC.1